MDKKFRHPTNMIFCLVFRIYQLLIFLQVCSYTRLDLCKIDKNNKTLLKLRSRSVNEQNKLQDVGGEDNANKSDVTAATEKTLNTDDETTIRGEAEFY